MKRRSFIKRLAGLAAVTVAGFYVPGRPWAGRIASYRKQPHNHWFLGRYSDDWYDRRNWANGQIPEAGDDVTIASGTLSATHRDHPIILNSVTILAGAYVVLDEGTVDMIGPTYS